MANRDQKPKRVVVAGASGLVGLAAVRHFAQLADWEVVGLSRRIPGDVPGATLRSVDLTDRGQCEAVVADLGDVTHLVYAALYEKPGLVQGWFEDDQMQTNLRMLQNLFEPLLAQAGGLEHVSLLQGTKAYGVHIEVSPVPARERWPRHPHRNFYFLQEDYLREKQAGRSWAWTILRPQVIFGESVGSPMNLLPVIGVYGALLAASDCPLWFPGGAASVSEAVDADLLARALAWAATSPAAANEIFNITNGDVFSWPDLWPAIAEALGMAPGENRPMQLSVGLPERAPEWAAIVERHGLRSPPDLPAFVGDSLVYADALFGYGRQQPRFPQLVSTIKIRQAGFGDCIDTEDMFRQWFARLQRDGWLPRPGDV